jgi:hypothetical protein
MFSNVITCRYGKLEKNYQVYRGGFLLGSGTIDEIPIFTVCHFEK